MAGRARGDQRRPGGQVDLRQHLRWHHPGRRGGQRHHRGPRPGRASSSPIVHAPRRHQRRRGPRHPRAATCPTRLIAEPTMLDAARRAVGRCAKREDSRREHLRRRDHQGRRSRASARRARASSTACATRPTAPRSWRAPTPSGAARTIEGIPVFASVAEAVKETGADGVVHLGAAAGRRRRHHRGGRGRHRLHRLHHRGHPGPGRGAGLQPPGRGLPRHPAARPELPRASSAPASATSASPSGDIALAGRAGRHRVAARAR